MSILSTFDPVFREIDRVGIATRLVFVRSMSDSRYHAIGSSQSVQEADFSTFPNNSEPLLYASAEGLPEVLSAYIEHGPLIVATLSYPSGNIVRSSDRLQGLLVCCSCNTYKITDANIPLISEIADTLSAFLFATLGSEELLWHRQAQRTFVAGTNRLLGSDEWTDDSAASDPAWQKAMADSTIDILHQGMQLSRCGIILPMQHAPHCWSFIAQKGFKDSFLDSQDYYVRGHGLTGLTLEAKRGEVIVSDDVETDPRWSNRGRSIQEGEGLKLAFAGAPIFSQLGEPRSEPIGALICCRLYGAGHLNTRFRKHEQLHLQNIANQLAYGFDAVTWRQRQQERLRRQLRLSHIWAGDASDSEMLTEALQLLKEEAPVSRLLVSLVSEDRTVIEGAAVLGFRPDLKDDTVRPLHHTAPSDPKDEDILALVCRKKLREPFKVSPFDDSDQNAKYVDRYTAQRHDVTGQLVVIPMTGGSGDIVGVLLAELTEDVDLTTHHTDTFECYANIIAHMIELGRLKRATQRRNDTLESTLEGFSDTVLAGCADPSLILTHIITVLCKRFHFDKGVGYIFKEESGLLEGVVGHNVVCPAVSRTAYSVVDTVDSDESRNTSLAMSVFRTKQALFLDTMSSEIVDQDDREAVGIPCSDKGFAIPLHFGGQVEGVVVVTGSSPFNPLDEPRELNSLAYVVALALRTHRMQAQMRRLVLHDAAESVFIHASNRIAGGAEQIERLPLVVDKNASAIHVFLTEATRFLESQMCGLFIPADVLEVPSNDARSSDVRRILQAEAFQLHCAIGYPTDLLRTSEY